MVRRQGFYSRGSWKLATGNFPDISAVSRQAGLRRVPARSNPKINDNFSNQKNNVTKHIVFFLIRRQGFEPQLPGPKPGVLPLDDLRLYLTVINIYYCDINVNQ